MGLCEASAKANNKATISILKEMEKGRLSAVLLVLLLVGAVAGERERPDSAVLVVPTGCSLRGFPLLSEAVVGEELNDLHGLSIVFQSRSEPHLLFLRQGREVHRVALSEDLSASALQSLVRGEGVELHPRPRHLDDTEGAAASGQLDVEGHRFALFPRATLRERAAKRAASLGGGLLEVRTGEVQRAVAAWLSGQGVDTAHTGAFFDDALFFWPDRTLLPSRDRGRFPWAKGEPSAGDCVELHQGLLRSANCNNVAHCVVHWTPEQLKALAEQPIRSSQEEKKKEL